MIYHRFCSEVSLLANKENCKISKANLTILSRGGLSYYKRPPFVAFGKIKKKDLCRGGGGSAYSPPPEMTYYGILIQLVLCQTMNSQWLEICNSMAAYHARKYGI